MASKTIQQLTELSASPDASDAYVIVDVSDTTMAATGTNKKVTHTNAFGSFLTDLTGLSVGALSDVDLTGNADTYALLWDNTAGEWQPGPITSPTGEVDFVASGAISNGDRVYLKADGKVEVVADTGPVYGSLVTFESADINHTAATFDSASGKVVIAYMDAGNSSYGTAIVGTVSGTSISFGTAVVFESASTEYIGIAFDSTNNKVVIAYEDGGNSQYGTAIVGTVSGTSISFGTAVVFESAAVQYNAVCFDAFNDSVVVTYKDQGNSSYGTGIVGTVSGTSISFGTAVVFDSTGWVEDSSMAFDSANSKIVIAYRTEASPYPVKAIVATVSGTSISYGTAVTIEASAGISSDPSITYDSSAGKVVVAYDDANNSDYGTGIVGTVSGTSISFGTAVVFKSSHTGFCAISYNPVNNNTLITYVDVGDTSNGAAVIGNVSGNSISFVTEVVFDTGSVKRLTIAYDSANNKHVAAYRVDTTSGKSLVFGSSVHFEYLGIAKAAISDTATGTIVIDGGIATNQSSLTPGQLYYVDVDGTLTTTDTGVVAGKAYSATDLQVFT